MIRESDFAKRFGFVKALTALNELLRKKKENGGNNSVDINVNIGDQLMDGGINKNDEL